MLYYYCLLSFIVSSAVCSCPRWQRSVEALTGTCVFISSKDGERVKSRAESHSVLSTPLVRKLQEASQEYKFWWSIFFFFYVRSKLFSPMLCLKNRKKRKKFCQERTLIFLFLSETVWTFLFFFPKGYVWIIPVFQCSFFSVLVALILTLASRQWSAPRHCRPVFWGVNKGDKCGRYFRSAAEECTFFFYKHSSNQIKFREWITRMFLSCLSGLPYICVSTTLITHHF